MHIKLYRKYRPSSFSEVSGENEIVKSFRNRYTNFKRKKRRYTFYYRSLYGRV